MTEPEPLTDEDHERACRALWFAFRSDQCRPSGWTRDTVVGLTDAVRAHRLAPERMSPEGRANVERLVRVWSGRSRRDDVPAAGE